MRGSNQIFRTAESEHLLLVQTLATSPLKQALGSSQCSKVFSFTQNVLEKSQTSKSIILAPFTPPPLPLPHSHMLLAIPSHTTKSGDDPKFTKPKNQ